MTELDQKLLSAIYDIMMWKHKGVQVLELYDEQGKTITPDEAINEVKSMSIEDKAQYLEDMMKEVERK